MGERVRSNDASRCWRGVIGVEFHGSWGEVEGVTGAAMLIGREQEIAVLERLLERTPPRGAVLLMLGDPGIGKSSPLREAESRGRVRGFRILRLVGVECETAFPFAGLHQLTGPVLDRVSVLPRPEREALAGVFGPAEGPPPEPFLIDLAVFDLADPSFHRAERYVSLMFLVDAAVRAGHLEDARELVAELEPAARATPSPMPHTNLSYARAVPAADEDAEDLYLAALRQDLSDWPHARAKIELAYGSWLRRQERVREARSLLASAQCTFDRIGALPSGDEARLELRSAGAPIDWPESSAERLRQITELSALRLADDETAELLGLREAVVAMYRDRTRPDSPQ